MGRKHIVNEYFINCPHPITVAVVGCGGSGSQMLSVLAKIHTALVKTGRQGLYVEAYDPDKVTEANIARQSFFPGDIGYHKAVVLISRLNRSMGLQWKAVPEKYWIGHNEGAMYNQVFIGQEPANIIITCVDNVKTRLQLEKDIRKMKRWDGDAVRPLYWMDLGNSKDTGQVILGTIRVPKYNKQLKESKRKLLRVTEMYDYSEIKDDDSGPSCSTMESLGKQDLFINTFMAVYAGNILWKLLYEHQIEYRGVYVNLKTLTTNPIPV